MEAGLQTVGHLSSDTWNLDTTLDPGMDISDSWTLVTMDTAPIWKTGMDDADSQTMVTLDTASLWKIDGHLTFHSPLLKMEGYLTPHSAILSEIS